MASEDGSVDEEKKQEEVAGEEVDKAQVEVETEAHMKENEKEDGKVEDKEEKDSEVEEKEEKDSEMEEKDSEVKEKEEKGSEMEEKEEEVQEEKEIEKPEENSQTEGKEEEKTSKKKKRVRKGTPAKSESKDSVAKKARGELSSQEPPVTPVDRPTRERKTIERYTETSGGRSSAKPVSIEKGKGTQLKDIPNVAFKLSKIKPDDNLQLLHYILFGKRTKVHTLKKNISLFSGFVWIGNEEKQRTKVKEKIDKCVKEKLLFFCDILNIPILKATAKKEDLSVKLLEFLESPHATTEALLADNEVKGKRQKGKAKSSKSPSSVAAASETSSKKQKVNSESEKKRKRPAKKSEKDEEVERGESKDSSYDDDDDDEDNSAEAIPKEESDQENKSEDEEESEKVESKRKLVSKKSSSNGHKNADELKSAKKSSTTESPKPFRKSTKKSPVSAAKGNVDKTNTTGASGSSHKSKVISTKKQKMEEDESLSAKEKSSGKKQPSKSSSKATAKGQGGIDKATKKAKSQPSKEEMHAIVVDILKEVDFNTATLSDILKQLGTHFDVDLMHRKAEVKLIITDVINNMTDEDEDDEVDGAEDGDGDGEDNNNA